MLLVLYLFIYFILYFHINVQIKNTQNYSKYRSQISYLSTNNGQPQLQSSQNLQNILNQRRRIQTAEARFRRNRLASGTYESKVNDMSTNNFSQMFQSSQQSALETIYKTNIIQDKIERLKMRHNALQQTIHQQQNEINKLSRKISDQQSQNQKYDLESLQRQLYKKQEKLNDLTCQNATLQQKIRDNFQIERDFKDQVMNQNNQINQHLEILQTLMAQNQELFMQKEDLDQAVSDLNQDLSKLKFSNKQIIQDKQLQYENFIKQQMKQKQDQQLVKLNQIDQMQEILEQQEKQLADSYKNDEFIKLQHIYEALQVMEPYKNLKNDEQDMISNILTFAKAYKANQQEEGELLYQLDILNQEIKNIKENMLLQSAQEENKESVKDLIKQLYESLKTIQNDNIRQIIDIDYLNKLMQDQSQQQISSGELQD